MRNLAIASPVESEQLHDHDGINTLIEAVNELSREVRKLRWSLRAGSAIEDDPLRCPYCGSDDPWEDERIYCYDCKRTWIDDSEEENTTPTWGEMRSDPTWRCNKCGEDDRNCDCPPF